MAGAAVPAAATTAPEADGRRPALARELQYFERVKTRLRSRTAYDDVIKCIHLYNQVWVVAGGGLWSDCVGVASVQAVCYGGCDSKGLAVRPVQTRYPTPPTHLAHLPHPHTTFPPLPARPTLRPVFWYARALCLRLNTSNQMHLPHLQRQAVHKDIISRPELVGLVSNVLGRLFPDAVLRAVHTHTPTHTPRSHITHRTSSPVPSSSASSATCSAATQTSWPASTSSS
eukprot:358990-Chlamydomonas_euryale.AAC.2